MPVLWRSGRRPGAGAELRTLLVCTVLVAALSVATAPLASARGLDPAGVPTGCVGVVVAPGDDLTAALHEAGVGGTVCFTAGTYRLTRPLQPLAGQTLVGHGAVLDGSRPLDGFRRAANVWIVGGQHEDGERNGTCAHGTACTYPNDVLRDGARLTRVLRRADVAPGTFWFDYAHDRIVVGDDPAGHALAVMVAPTAILSRSGSAGAGVTVRGFVVQHVACMAQHGAIETSAPGWVIQGNTVQDNHGAGITTNGQARVLGNLVADNGQLGIGGTGDDTRVVGNTITGNNTAGFDPGWEAGGAKWALTDHLVVERNDVEDNAGPGLWSDIDSADTTYARNTVRDNARAGIFYEISTGGVIRDNVVTGNGHGFDTWLWGSGILLAASRDVAVTGNRLAGNAEGIGLIQQRRGHSTVTGLPRVLHQVTIADNIVRMASGESGAVTDDGYERLFSDATITWTGDVWHGAGGRPFDWSNRLVSLARWHALGHDS